MLYFSYSTKNRVRGGCGRYSPPLSSLDRTTSYNRNKLQSVTVLPIVIHLSSPNHNFNYPPADPGFNVLICISDCYKCCVVG